MPELDNYWLRRTRMNRRRLMGGAATAGLGAAALGLVGCGDDDDDDTKTTPAATSASGSPTAAASAAASPSAAAKQKGGTAHFISANNTFDTFDIDRSRFSPIAVLFGYTNLGVMQWQSYKDGKIGGAIAEKVEQPDKQTFVFSVRPNLFWHNKAPVNGRAATPTTSRSSSSATRAASSSTARRIRTSTASPRSRASTRLKWSTRRPSR